MQFYVVWPFVFIIAGWISRRTRSGIAPFVLALGAITLASFVYSLIATPANPGPAYFNPFARIWEFSAGGLCAVLLPYLSLTKTVRVLCGWTGLLLILGCAALLPRSVQFPGYVALIPVAGAILIILAGTSASRFGVDRLLASPPLVALGGLSFTFYLWHWPVLVFFLEATDQTHVGLVDGLIIIVIALCGAYLTMRFIELPIQRSSFGRAKTWYTYALGAALAIPVVATAGLWRYYITETGQEAADLAQLPMAQQTPALQLEVLQNNAEDVPDVQLITAKTNVAIAYYDGCHQQVLNPVTLACEYGLKTNPAKTIALVGSSHMTQWLPAFRLIAQQYSLKIILITKRNCTFGALEKANESCRKWNVNVIAKLAELHPDAVVVNGTRPTSSNARKQEPETPIEYVPREFIAQWKQVEKLGISLIALRDNPWFDIDIATCVARYETNPLNCALPRKQALLPENPAIDVKPKFKDLTVLDLTSYLCSNTMCPAVTQNILMYRDQDHLSLPYVQSLAAPLEQKMRQQRPDLFVPLNPVN